MPAAIEPRPRFQFRIQDLLLALLFGVLICFAHESLQRLFLTILAVLHLIDGKTQRLKTLPGRATLTLLQLVAVYWLIGKEEGINTNYFLLFLLPIVSAATYLRVAGAVLTSVVAIGSYLSFLLYVDWRVTVMNPEDMHVLGIRCLVLAIAAVLVNSLGESIRVESARYKATAEQLSAANQSLRNAEAAVRRSERLAALGQLSAGLAHELRNPLGSIKGSSELLVKSAARDNEVIRELAQIISEEVDRTNSLVTRFLDFARPLEPRGEQADITRVIDRAAAHARVPIIRSYSPDVPTLAIDPGLMEQVFINLLTNAAQASAPDAPITVATREMDGQVQISVVDRGCGIPPDKIETIFNPFVTTKQNGVGLGLAIVSKIVDGHGGRITVESEPGKGSTFRVSLPIQNLPVQ